MKILSITQLISFILFLFLIPSLHLEAKGVVLEKTKTIEKSFEVTEATELKLKNRRGGIQIINVEGSEAKIELNISVTGNDINDLEKFIDQYELSSRVSGSMIDIVADDHIKNWTKIYAVVKKSNKITLEDGTKIKDIEEIDVEMIVYLPKISLLITENKYNDLVFDELDFDLSSTIYSGNLIGKNINGALHLEMKYGEVKINDFKDAEIDIYDSEFTSGSGGCVSFKSKYSDIMMGDFESLDFKSYDDDIKMGKVAGEFDFEAKYCDVRMGSFGEGDFEIYDTDIDGKNGSNLSLKSKYGSIEFESLGATELDLYEDDFDVSELKDLTIKSSKYSDITINTFEGEMNIRSSYQDEIYVSQKITNFKGLYLDAKYIKMEFPIAPSVPYVLDFELKYGDIDFTDRLEMMKKDKDDNVYELWAFANGGNEDSPKIEIESYQGDIDIKY